MSKPFDFAQLGPPPWGQWPSAILRVGEGPYVRSPYAAEASPWVAREEWETLLLLRGAIVASFGQIETALAELAIRLSRDPQCAALRTSYPHGLGKRLSFLRACFALAPYRRRRGLAEQVFNRFERAADLRHIMAHGSVSGPHLDWLVTFRDFRSGPGSEIVMRDNRYTYAELELAAFEAGRLSRRVARLTAQVTASGWLPPVD